MRVTYGGPEICVKRLALASGLGQVGWWATVSIRTGTGPFLSGSGRVITYNSLQSARTYITLESNIHDTNHAALPI